MRLEELRRELASAIRDQPPVQSDARDRVQRLVRRHRARGAGMAGLLLVAIVVAGTALLRPNDRAARISTGPRIAATDMPADIVTVTTDGRLVVMRSSDGHVIRQLANHAVVDARGASGDVPSLAVTPDGKTVYFMSVDNAFNGATISSVPLAGGPVTSLLGPGCCVHYPAVSPDGRWLAYTGVPDRSDAGRDILLLDLTISRGANTASYTRRWTSGAPLGPGIGIGPLAWAADSQHLAFVNNDAPNPQSPRVLDISAPESTLLDQLPNVHLPDGEPGPARWAGYLGNTGEMLGITSGDSRVVTTDAKTGIVTHLLFTLRGAATPAADQSGKHIVVTANNELYTWSEGNSTARKVANRIAHATWVPSLATFSLHTVPQGVSTRELDGTPVFVVRLSDHVDAFLTDVHHLGQRHLWWCPQDHRFVGPRYAEQFDVLGQVLGGPTGTGLDRLSTEVRNRLVIVHLDQRLPGPPRGTHAPLPSAWLPRVGRDDALCDNPMKQGPVS